METLSVYSEYKGLEKVPVNTYRHGDRVFVNMNLVREVEKKFWNFHKKDEIVKQEVWEIKDIKQRIDIGYGTFGSDEFWMVFTFERTHDKQMLEMETMFWKYNTMLADAWIDAGHGVKCNTRVAETNAFQRWTEVSEKTPKWGHW